MDNQHKLIKGYRDLSKQEIDLMNEIKSKAEEVGILVKKVHEVIDTASNDEDGREEDCNGTTILNAGIGGELLKKNCKADS